MVGGGAKSYQWQQEAGVWSIKHQCLDVLATATLLNTEPVLDQPPVNGNAEDHETHSDPWTEIVMTILPIVFMSSSKKAAPTTTN